MFILSHFQKLYILKSLDVEEPIDLYWHRPIAAFITAFLLSIRVPITPNRITLASLLTGWSGSILLYFVAFSPETLTPLWPIHSPYGWFLAGFLYMLSVILDCADGQLARYQGGGTRMGRILDGIVDALVALPLWIIMGIWLYKTFGSIAFWYTFVVGWNQWFQITLYDRVKTIYLGRTCPSTADGNEDRSTLDADYQNTMQHGPIVEKVMMFLYYRMLLVQDAALSKGNETSNITKINIPLFQKEMRSWMRAASFLGLGTHMFLTYWAVALTGIFPISFIIMETIFLTIFNILIIIGILGTKKMLNPKYIISHPNNDHC